MRGRAATGAPATGALAWAPAAASMSARRMGRLRPLQATSAMSAPRSRAIRRARGLAYGVGASGSVSAGAGGASPSERGDPPPDGGRGASDSGATSVDAGSGPVDAGAG